MHTNNKCKMTSDKIILALNLLAVVMQVTSATHCSFASRLEEASIYQESAHYFDYDHKLPCAGDIVAWRYCYYTADLANAYYWIRFQIWRQIDDGSLIRNVHSYHVHLDTLSSNKSFVCLKKTVSEPIPVEVGDFLGVNLPLRITNPIPVIGHGLLGSVLYRDVGGTSSIRLRRMEGFALHVDAEIVIPSSSATSRLQSSQTVSEMPYYTAVAPSTTLLVQTSSVNMPQSSFSTVSPTPSSTQLDLSSSVNMPQSSFSTVSLTPSSTQLDLSSEHFATSIGTVTAYSQISESVINIKGSISSKLYTRNTPVPFQVSVFPADSDKTGVARSTSEVTATPTTLPKETISEEYVPNWPFITGLVIGAILLVLIVIVSILLILVVCVRQRADQDKFPAAESDALFNNIVLVAIRTGQEEASTAVFDHSPSCKAVKVPTLLNTRIAPDESERVDPCSVYDAPCKMSPTSKSSVSSIFSSEEGHHISAQPYETPLVTSLSSRLNLFPSTSTLDTNTGSELVSKSQLHPQQNPPGSMTLDRLRVLKVKKPVLKPPLPDKELPVLVLPERLPKAKAPTPEAESDRASVCADDEGYGTVRNSVRLLEQASIDTNIPSPQDMYCTPPNDERDILETLDRMNVTNIPREDIQVISHIGTGEFASVAKAYWKNEIEVAVKSMPPDTDIEERVKLLQEAAMMGQFRHPNVVQLHGIVTAGTSFMLVLGYLAKGDLRTHLTHMNQETLLPSTPKLLMSYSQQVALGMHYLASKGFVHRDLAARNIFISENNTCKVGDFGMSRDLANAPYYISKGGKIPVRWTAPEAMYYHKYSTASDVWSYGCVLYEIWSLGELPFKKYTNAQVLERLDSGYRLPPPPGTPRPIYELMMQTWHPNARHRPEFRNILLQLVRDEACLLHIPVSDASTSQQASQLGSPLTAGEYMYSDLQKAYLRQQNQTRDEEQYDSLMGQKYVLSFPTSSADIDYLYNDQNPPQRSFRSQLLTSDTESDY